MQIYLWLKLLHILSATFMFGTGIGTAFFLWLAYLSKDPHTFKNTTRHVIVADWIFTAPSVILQPVTGIYLMHLYQYPLNSLWFLIVLALYSVAGLCWIWVVVIQYRLHQLAMNAYHPVQLAQIKHYMRLWVALGIPAFAALLVIYWLMLSKWGMSIALG